MKIVFKSDFRGPCIICRCMPVDEESRERKPLPMFHAEGVDVNWGEDVNICQVCAGVMSDMMGRADEVTVQRLKTENKGLNAAYDELTKKYNEQTTRIKKILEGRKAEKTQREAK